MYESERESQCTVLRVCKVSNFLDWFLLFKFHYITLYWFFYAKLRNIRHFDIFIFSLFSMFIMTFPCGNCWLYVVSGFTVLMGTVGAHTYTHLDIFICTAVVWSEGWSELWVAAGGNGLTLSLFRNSSSAYVPFFGKNAPQESCCGKWKMKDGLSESGESKNLLLCVSRERSWVPSWQ